jgi:hypothetical protein
MAVEVKLICLRDQARSLRHIGTTGKSANVCQVLISKVEVSRKMASFDSNRLSASRNLIWTPKVLRLSFFVVTIRERVASVAHRAFATTEALVAELPPGGGQVLGWSAGEPARQPASRN